jgi:hypothetical protein
MRDKSLVQEYLPKIVDQIGMIHEVPVRCEQITSTSMSG